MMVYGKNVRNISKRLFVCGQCGSCSPATKTKRMVEGRGHIKDMWCFRCKAETRHIQIE